MFYFSVLVNDWVSSTVKPKSYFAKTVCLCDRYGFISKSAKVFLLKRVYYVCCNGVKLIASFICLTSEIGEIILLNLFTLIIEGSSISIRGEF